ncbi:MAG: ATP-binding protein [bacterium]
MVNNYKLAGKKNYRPRWLVERIKNALDVNPVIVITGARQTGKSTLILNEKPFCDWHYLSFDDLDVIAQAKRDPNVLLGIGRDVVIDEVQKVPQILTVIKRIVDKDRKRHFVLSGSANLLLMKQVTESLAGRSSYYVLFPFSLREWQKKAPTLLVELVQGDLPTEKTLETMNPLTHIFRGFLPPVLNLLHNEQITTWWEGYVKTYLERDLRNLTDISSLSDFKRVMEICAVKSGSILNEMDIARKCGMSQPTVHRYINLLEASCLFIKLRPFTKGRLRRIIKSPKGYFLDPGLVSYLAGFRDFRIIPLEFQGYLFETLILLHLSIYASLLNGNLYYWRTWGGKEKEVDFVLEIGQKIIAIEVKLTNRVNYNDIQNIQYFIEEYPAAIAGVIVYAGSKIEYLTKNILAVPWNAFC